ncbi:hypothetical protein CR159_14270 [Pollutimonas subterranea]|uniref:Uncharacterized protein n=1 Tax=Pollutimonas subterranea TaxID=2045210 RepID=A0A2N4U2D6_9BURK|nr:hypothetical protein CR159_14270 [Pollutimonas subterranea]
MPKRAGRRPVQGERKTSFFPTKPQQTNAKHSPSWHRHKNHDAAVGVVGEGSGTVGAERADYEGSAKARTNKAMRGPARRAADQATRTATFPHHASGVSRLKCVKTKACQEPPPV